MKTFILSAFLITLFSCGTTKSYLQREDEDKSLLSAVRQLNKQSSDTAAMRALPVLYNSVKTTHLNRIASLAQGADLTRWDKVISEYNQLQEAYDAIINSTPAFRLVTPQNFSADLLEAKQQAANEYYALGNSTLDKGGRENAKLAYNYFKRTDRYVPNYAQVRAKMTEALESSVVKVVINPVQDNSYFGGSNWGRAGTGYSNEYFQQTLLQDLQNSNNGAYAARFYTPWQAQTQNIQADWVVDLRLRDLNMPRPSTSSASRNASAQIQIGTDTAHNPVYKNVYATVYVNRASFTASATMEVNIKDLHNNNVISYRTFRNNFTWQEESATYSGDSRALSTRDWELINKTGYREPAKEEVVHELYKKIYPQVKENISYATAW